MSRPSAIAIPIVVVAICACASPVAADEATYRYEGDVMPYDPSAGWDRGNPCEGVCSEYIEDGHYVLYWPVAGDLVFQAYRLAVPPEEPPPSLWVEWRFRSNHPLALYSWTCDASFTVDYAGILQTTFMYGDAAISFGGDFSVNGLDLDEFHTYRFESPDGAHYRISVDGMAFIEGVHYEGNDYHALKLGGRGGCIDDQIPDMINEWDFIRYGTIGFGEQIVAHDPPERFLDARTQADLDGFTVTYDSPNYVYIDDIIVNATGGMAPAVTQTRRREFDEPDTVEIVLDGPLPVGETTYFIFDDGVGVNIVAYTFAPGDSDGDGDADLADFAALQNCLGADATSGLCRASDLDGSLAVDLADFAQFAVLLTESD